MAKIKEILCIHHSHLDVGYTHPQHMLLELQCDYIDQALDLCDSTADWPEESRFRWTCEASYVVKKWFETADEDRKAQFRRLVRSGRISIAALPMHTTPGISAAEMTQMLQDLDELRQLTGSDIRCAINHDVNGQPWTLAPVMLDSGIQFYLTGINIHMGGIPFPRPYAFRWQAPDGRSIPSFVGEHYSLFSQFFFTEDFDLKKMHQGVQEYVSRIESTTAWPYDFVLLTATNPPLYDNNCPDAQLAQLIRDYNAENHEQKIRFITPEMLFERLRAVSQDLTALPEHAGDWTDYWNFGSASTAKETTVSRRAKTLLGNADFLECAAEKPLDQRCRQARNRAWENVMLYEEHTWGASQSITDPDCDETVAQLIHKKAFAYRAAELGAYALGREMETAAGNAIQANEKQGVLISNPTAYPQRQEVRLPESLVGENSCRTLASLRIKTYLPYTTGSDSRVYCGYADVAPCSVTAIPFSALRREVPEITVTDTEILTPYYRVELEKNTGRILQITDLRTGFGLLNSNSSWQFFEPIVERIDGALAPQHRDTIFPRDIDLGNRSITQWQHDWPAKHMRSAEPPAFEVRRTETGVALTCRSSLPDLKDVVRTVTFSGLHDRISLDVTFSKSPVVEPDSLYFTLPLALAEGWDCVYDTADSFVHLDRQQLGTVCRDFITLDRAVSLFDGTHGVTLACPDAPLVQISGFRFGRESRSIERCANPMLLAWPLNNYWETNFAATQEGQHHLHYELTSYGEFDVRRMRQAGVAAAQPCAVGSALRCEASEKQLLCCTGADPMFFLPDPQGRGFVAAVKNLRDTESLCTLSSPIYPDAAFAVVTPQGVPAGISGSGSLELTLEPNRIRFIHVTP